MGSLLAVDDFIEFPFSKRSEVSPGRCGRNESAAQFRRRLTLTLREGRDHNDRSRSCQERPAQNMLLQTVANCIPLCVACEAARMRNIAPEPQICYSIMQP